MEEIEIKLEKREKAREKRKTKRMRVSGKSVFVLRKIIRRKASDN